jgi:ABC-type bacteriocin/lantibiotic exporter with double-glycine peptidase domain
VDVIPARGVKIQDIGALEMRDVTFRYEGRDSPVLAGVSVHIPRGSVCAFVGKVRDVISCAGGCCCSN